MGTEQRDEAFAVESDPVHEAIHNERGARHVARAFEQSDKEKQNENLRKEFDDATDATDHTGRNKITEITVGHGVFDPRGQDGRLVVDPIHGRLRQRKNTDEEQGHHCAQHGPAPHRVGDDGIDFVGGCRAGFAGLKNHLGSDPADRVVAGVHQCAGPVSALAFPTFLPRTEDVFGAGMERGRAGDAHAVLVSEQQQGFGAGNERGFAVVRDEGGLKFGDCGSDRGGNIPSVPGQREVWTAHGDLELDEAFAVHRFARDDGNAECLLESRDADSEAGGSGQIHHVDDENDGATQVENLVNEIEISFQIRGIDDAKNPVGLRGVGAATEEDVAGHGFIGGTRGERIRARQIDDRDGLAMLRVGRADLFFHGNAGVVAHLLF